MLILKKEIIYIYIYIYSEEKKSKGNDYPVGVLNANGFRLYN